MGNFKKFEMQKNKELINCRIVRIKNKEQFRQFKKLIELKHLNCDKHCFNLIANAKKMHNVLMRISIISNDKNKIKYCDYVQNYDEIKNIDKNEYLNISYGTEYANFEEFISKEFKEIDLEEKKENEIN